VPLILRELRKAGASDEAITFVTASGMHDPMTHDELARKLGANTVSRYRCISHDGGDWNMLAYGGLTAMGTPVWVNRWVADADFVVGLGRVYPHPTHGFEGGYKLILPGVSGFDTILRDHSFNYSPCSIPGQPHNPSRAETDAVGRMIGIDFLINVVVNREAEPIRAFSGAVEPVFNAAVAYGNQAVWGATIGQPVDITVASPGSRTGADTNVDTELVRRACTATRPGGTVIVLATDPPDGLPDWRSGNAADDAELETMGRETFGRALRDLAFSELMRLHERRDWPISPREIQWRAKAIRGEYYRRRWLMSAENRRVVFTTNPQPLLDTLLADHRPPRMRVAILPEGRTTLPLVSSPTCHETFSQVID
jgi:hypothetical protein